MKPVTAKSKARKFPPVEQEDDDRNKQVPEDIRFKLCDPGKYFFFIPSLIFLSTTSLQQEKIK